MTWLQRVATYRTKGGNPLSPRTQAFALQWSFSPDLGPYAVGESCAVSPSTVRRCVHELKSASLLPDGPCSDLESNLISLVNSGTKIDQRPSQSASTKAGGAQYTRATTPARTRAPEPESGRSTGSLTEPPEEERRQNPPNPPGGPTDHKSILEVWTYWQELCGSKRHILTDKRKRQIKARLRRIHIERIKAAIYMLSQRAFNIEHGKLDLELVTRADDRAEKYFDWAGAELKVGRDHILGVVRWLEDYRDATGVPYFGGYPEADRMVKEVRSRRPAEQALEQVRLALELGSLCRTSDAVTVAFLEAIEAAKPPPPPVEEEEEAEETISDQPRLLALLDGLAKSKLAQPLPQDGPPDA